MISCLGKSQDTLMVIGYPWNDAPCGKRVRGPAWRSCQKKYIKIIIKVQKTAMTSTCTYWYDAFIVKLYHVPRPYSVFCH